MKVLSSWIAFFHDMILKAVSVTKIVYDWSGGAVGEHLQGSHVDMYDGESQNVAAGADSAASDWVDLRYCGNPKFMCEITHLATGTRNVTLEVDYGHLMAERIVVSQRDVFTNQSLVSSIVNNFWWECSLSRSQGMYARVRKFTNNGTMEVAVNIRGQATMMEVDLDVPTVDMEVLEGNA